MIPAILDAYAGLVPFAIVTAWIGGGTCRVRQGKSPGPRGPQLEGLLNRPFKPPSAKMLCCKFGCKSLQVWPSRYIHWPSRYSHATFGSGSGGAWESMGLS